MPSSLLRAARILAATLATAALVLVSVPLGAAALPTGPSASSTPIGGSSAEIVVKTGGLRTGTANPDIATLDGVHLELWNSNNTAKVDDGAGTWADCYSVAGECVFTVPNASTSNTRFWIHQAASLAGSPAANNYLANPNLVTALDNSNFDVSAYQFRTNEIADSTRNVSGTDFMTLSTGNQRDVSSGFWQNSYKNPAALAKCGLNIAVLADLSSSVNASALADLKEAATAFVTALTGTPSTISLYTFGTTAPAPGANNSNLTGQSALNSAQMTALKNKIAGLTVPGSSYTNWDAGLWQLQGGAFDQVIVITDGNPTAYGVNTHDRRRRHPLQRDRASDLLGEQAQVAGHAHRHGRCRLELRGRREPQGDLRSRARLGLLRRRLGFPLDDPSNIAAANCGGTVTVVKKVIPYGGTAATAVATGGWTINATVPARRLARPEHGRHGRQQRRGQLQADATSPSPAPRSPAPRCSSPATRSRSSRRRTPCARRPAARA